MAERGSDKDGPRLDDEWHAEVEPIERDAPVESRVEEAREAEPAYVDEPVSESLLSRPADAVDREGRAEVARYLDRSIFPADRDSLIESARARHAPPFILETLRALPYRIFESVDEAWRAARRRLHEGGGR